jgi:RimJ/RimL family protein N-acetyltransferase
MTSSNTAQAPTTASVRDLTGVELATSRLLLREFRETDIDAVCEACQDEEIGRFMLISKPYHRVHAEKFIRENCPTGRSAGTDAVFGVFAADTGTLVGSVGLHSIAHVNDSIGGGASIGYWTAPWSRRRGYMSEAVGAVCRWAFEELGLVVIRWDAIAGNEGSLKVARSNGFVLEGTRRSYLVHRGERKDMWVGSLLAADFADHATDQGR